MFAAVAELADAQDLGSCPERGGGSSPSRRRLNCLVMRCSSLAHGNVG